MASRPKRGQLAQLCAVRIWRNHYDGHDHVVHDDGCYHGPHGPRLRAAYEQVLPEIKALSSDSLINVTSTFSRAVSKSLGALPEIRALRPKIVEEMPKLDFARFDKLETYTLAACHAQGLYMAASEPLEALDAVASRPPRFANAC